MSLPSAFIQWEPVNEVIETNDGYVIDYGHKCFYCGELTAESVVLTCWQIAVCDRCQSHWFIDTWSGDDIDDASQAHYLLTNYPRRRLTIVEDGVSGYPTVCFLTDDPDITERAKEELSNPNVYISGKGPFLVEIWLVENEDEDLALMKEVEALLSQWGTTTVE
jgi:hypothetical protein